MGANSKMERENIISTAVRNIESNTTRVRLGVKAVDSVDMISKYFIISLDTPGADPAYEIEVFLSCFTKVTGVSILGKDVSKIKV